jgi:hypothetical protein
MAPTDSLEYQRTRGLPQHNATSVSEAHYGAPVSLNDRLTSSRQNCLES